MASFKPPGQCPNCGEWVPRGALACDECGSCAKSGWNDEAQLDGLDLPSDDFDYHDFIAREFGDQESSQGRLQSSEKLWKGVALVLVIVLLLSWLLSGH